MLRTKNYLNFFVCMRSVYRYLYLFQIADMFERLPDSTVIDIDEDYDYSVRLQYFGGLSSRDNKTVTITTS